MLSWFRETVFCEFKLDGVLFTADEGPWGDDSRYSIAPKRRGRVPQLDVIRNVFVNTIDLPTWGRIVLVAGFAILVAFLLLFRCGAG